jgi:hypothetical protein
MFYHRADFDGNVLNRFEVYTEQTNGQTRIHLSLSLSLSLSIYIYIYIYMLRETEREIVRSFHFVAYLPYLVQWRI